MPGSGNKNGLNINIAVVDVGKSLYIYQWINLLISSITICLY